MLQQSVATASLTQVFQALADPSRLDMVERLSRGPASVSELAGGYAMSMSAVMQHLRVLEAGGIVRTQKTGRIRTCRIEPAALDAVAGWVAAHRARLEHRLDLLEAYLDKEEGA